MKVNPAYITDLTVPASDLRTFETTLMTGETVDVMAPSVWDALGYVWDNDIGTVIAINEA